MFQLGGHSKSNCNNKTFFLSTTLKCVYATGLQIFREFVCDISLFSFDFFNVHSYFADLIQVRRMVIGLYTIQYGVWPNTFWSHPQLGQTGRHSRS